MKVKMLVIGFHTGQPELKVNLLDVSLIQTDNAGKVYIVLDDDSYYDGDYFRIETIHA